MIARDVYVSELNFLVYYNNRATSIPRENDPEVYQPAHAW